MRPVKQNFAILRDQLFKVRPPRALMLRCETLRARRAAVVRGIPGALLREWPADIRWGTRKARGDLCRVQQSWRRAPKPEAGQTRHPDFAHRAFCSSS